MNKPHGKSFTSTWWKQDAFERWHSLQVDTTFPSKKTLPNLNFQGTKRMSPTSQTCGCWESTSDNQYSHSSPDRRVRQPCDLKIFWTLIKRENQSAENLLKYTDKNLGRFIEVSLISILQTLVDLCDNWTQFQKAVALPFVRVPTWRSGKVSRANYQTQLKYQLTVWINCNLELEKSLEAREWKANQCFISSARVYRNSSLREHSSSDETPG